MPVPVLLEPGCCDAGTGAAAAVRAGGGKAVVLPRTASRGQGDAPHAPDGPDGIAPLAWAARLAEVWGLHRDLPARGLAVPLAAELSLWDVVAAEVEAARADAVVVRVPRSLDPVSLLEAAPLAVRALDTRLAALAPTLGEDAAVAGLLEDALALRAAAATTATLAASATVVGTLAEHGPGCPAPLLAAGRVPRAEPLADPTATHGCATTVDGYRWWCDLPGDQPPGLELEDDLLHLALPTTSRTVRLPAALARCEVLAARVAPGPAGHRLEVDLRPDPRLWR